VPAIALSARDFRKIIEIIDVIYSVPDNSAMFQAVCEKLQKHIGFYSGVFAFADPKTSVFLISGCESYQNSQGALILYLAHYAALDPFVTSGYFFGNRINITARNTDLESENSLLRSEFSCDFLLPMTSVFYALAATLGSQGDIIARIGFHRKKREGNFSDGDKQVVNILLPHMARAIHSRNLMNRFVQRKYTDGVIAIGKDGRPFFVSDTAKRLLKGVPAESIPDPGMGPDPVFYKCKSGAYRVRTMPLGRNGSGKVVLLERYPPEHRLHPKFAELKLSGRESEIATLVVQGYSNREIAEMSFICEQTVKDHLHAIFEKLEIRSRGELTAKVLGLRTEPSLPRYRI
jgi:DNA-binding CsgD family transcriptional regulator